MKPTITEFQAEELMYETGKTFTELSEQYNIVEINDYMNHGEEFI